ncbi:hypothetical protein SAMN05216317_102139 [Nitrosomonas eutropha]|nr:hypothetical protein [Nitrosomonas sp. GH22]SDW13112.1 hypothetical protein SAMN05216317_102139 [Nitrosomonas eutropha]
MHLLDISSVIKVIRLANQLKTTLKLLDNLDQGSIPHQGHPWLHYFSTCFRESEAFIIHASLYFFDVSILLGRKIFQC